MILTDSNLFFWTGPQFHIFYVHTYKAWSITNDSRSETRCSPNCRTGALLFLGLSQMVCRKSRKHPVRRFKHFDSMLANQNNCWIHSVSYRRFKGTVPITLWGKVAPNFRV